MRFRPERNEEEIHVNVVPFIDVLLVLLIFFLVATSFIEHSRLAVNLPQASLKARPDDADALHINIAPDGRVAIDDEVLERPTVETLKTVLALALGPATDSRPVLISADAEARHQSLVTVMDALQQLGVQHLGIATAADPQGGTP